MVRKEGKGEGRRKRDGEKRKEGRSGGVGAEFKAVKPACSKAQRKERE